MAFPPGFLDDLRSRLALSDVIGKRVKLTKKNREYSGLCPFHNEKTPSFTVNNEKGFYHCFGCGAHGDIIKFMMDIEKLPFLEAVERLAGMAGMPMPERSPHEQMLYQKQSGLLTIMEDACRFFQEQLFSPAGNDAKAYLIKRGITPTVAKEFRLGYAPGGGKLTTFLTSKGHKTEDCLKLGLVRMSKDRPTPNNIHDYFYDRIMFPITNRQGKVNAFGGRIMGKGEPKYLNSPETELFHKGDQLFALKNASSAIRLKNESIIVEGYMDVISLHAAGFTNAVAPLGTALTENQIKLLWTMCDEPTVCFDGDRAGRGAAIRAMMRALPILTAGKSLKFAWLPNGLDPDDMIKKKSPEAFAEILTAAKPMTETLWHSLLENRSINTPERMAKLESDVDETLKTIQDKTVQSYYKQTFKEYLWNLRRNKNKPGGTSIPARTAILAPKTGLAESKMMLGYLVCYPKVSEKFIEEIGSFDFPDPVLANAFARLSEEILNNPNIAPDDIKQTLDPEALAMIMPEIEMLQKSNRFDRTIQKELRGRISDAKIQSLKQEIQSATDAYASDPSPEKWAEIQSLKEKLGTEAEKQGNDED